MATDLERLIVSLEANVRGYERELRRAREQTDRASRDIERRLEGMSARVNSIMSTSAKAIGALTTSFLSVNALKGYADAWTEAGNKIAAAGEEGAIAAKRQSELADIAIRSRSEFGATVDLYTGLYKATEELGKTQEDVARVTETISKAFTVGGQSASNAADAIRQLNQAFSAGKLSGDELNSVLEGAPPLARLIATEFKVGVGQLKKLGEDGKLSADKVFGAILKGTAEIERQFAVTVPTISNSFTNLNTALTRYVGQVDQGAGASAKFSQAINAMATNIDVVAPIAVSLAAALLAFTVGGPVGAGLAGLTTAFYLLGDSISPIQGELATLGDYAASAFNMAMTAGGEAATYIQQQYAAVADALTTALSAAGTDAGAVFDAVVSAVKTQVNAIIGTFVFAAKTIKATWDTLGFAMAETIANAMNSVIATVESALQAVSGAVNSIVSKINSASTAVGGGQLPTLGDVNLGRVRNGYAGAGAAAGKAYGEAFQSLTTDYVGATVDGARGILQKLRDDANARAGKRAADAKSAADALAQSQRDAATVRAGRKKPGTGEDDDKKGGKKEKLNDYQKEIEAIEKRTRAFDAEREAVGRSAIETAKSEAAFRLMEAAKKANVPITDELRAKVDTLSNAYAAAKVQLDETERAQQRAVAAQRYFGDAATDALTDLAIEGRSATEVFENLTKSILKAATQAALMGTGPLAGLFGSPANSNGAGGGILGSLLSGFSQNPTGRYAGGPVKAGVGYDVGESGRERFVPTSPGRIIPNRKLGGGNVQVIDQRSMTAPPMETRRGPGGNPQIIVRDAYNSMQGEARRRGQRGPGYGVG